MKSFQIDLEPAAWFP